MKRCIDNKQLHIAINALAAAEGGGVNVARNLIREMGKLKPEYRFSLFYSDPRVDAPGLTPNIEKYFLPQLSGAIPRSLWELFRLPGFLRNEGVGSILLLGGYSTCRSKCPKVSVWQNSIPVSGETIQMSRSYSAYVRIQRMIMRWSMKRVSQNVFLTENTASLTSKWWSLRGIPYCVIHNGVDPELLPKQTPPSLDARGPVVLSVGHIYHHKNYDALIDAMEIYKNRFESDLRLLILGGPAIPKELYNELNQRICDKKLGKSISMPGPASTDQVAEAMRTAKVYITASSLETFGLTLAEAMAYGIPILSSDRSCLPEVCGNAAIFFDPSNPEEIAQKLHQLVMDEPLQQELRDKGFERVKEFRWENAAEKYLQELERVAQR